MSFSDYLVEKWLGDFSTCFVALHYDDPRTAGAYASEVWGGAYARCRATFSLPGNRVTWNSTVLHFAGLPGTLITHLAIWDVEVNGNFMASGVVPNGPVRVAPGGRYDLGVNQFAVSIRS